MIYFQTHSRGCWQTQVLTRNGPESPVPFHGGLSKSSSEPCLLTSPEQREKETARPKLRLFYHLTSEETCHHFCHIHVFFTSESVGPAHCQGEGSSKGPAYQEQGSRGASLEPANHRWARLAKAEVLCTPAASAVTHGLVTTWELGGKCGISGPTESDLHFTRPRGPRRACQSWRSSSLQHLHTLNRKENQL